MKRLSIAAVLAFIFVSAGLAGTCWSFESSDGISWGPAPMPQGPGWLEFSPAPMPPAQGWGGFIPSPTPPGPGWGGYMPAPMPLGPTGPEFKRGPAAPERFRKRARLFFKPEYWLERLDLTREQRVEVWAAVLEPLTLLNQLRADKASLKLRLMYLREKSETDQEEVKKLFSEMGRLDGEIFLAEKAYEKAVEAVLKQGDLKKLRAMLDM